MSDGSIFKKAQVFDPNTMSMRDAVVPTGESVDVSLAPAVDAAETGAEAATAEDTPKRKKKRFRKNKN